MIQVLHYNLGAQTGVATPVGVKRRLLGIASLIFVVKRNCDDTILLVKYTVLCNVYSVVAQLQDPIEKKNIDGQVISLIN